MLTFNKFVVISSNSLFLFSTTTPSPLKSPNSSMITPTNNGVPPALPPKRARTKSNISEPPLSPTIPERKASPVKSLPDLLEHTANSSSIKPSEEKKSDKRESGDFNTCDIDLIEELDVTKHLVVKKTDEDGPEIRGGQVDGLIIMATKATKNGGKSFLSHYMLV